MRRLGNMSPALAIDDPANIGGGDSVTLTKPLLVSIARRRFSDFPNVVLGQFVSSIRNALVVSASAFFLPVSNIVRVRSKKKVIRIATLPVVARVENQFVFWDFSNADLKSDTRSDQQMMIEAERSVSLTARQLPGPTAFSVSDFNLHPKSLDKDRRDLNGSKLTSNLFAFSIHTILSHVLGRFYGAGTFSFYHFSRGGSSA